MRRIVASFLLLGCSTPQVIAFQARGGAATKPAISACSLLSRELAMKVSVGVNKLIFDMKPEEEKVGNGTACEYADIGLQIDVLTPERIAAIPADPKTMKEWVAVAGVGDRAYFRNNKNRFAELIGSVGVHTFTIQMGVPTQGTAEGIKPNVIELANAIVPRLR